MLANPSSIVSAQDQVDRCEDGYVRRGRGRDARRLPILPQGAERGRISRGERRQAERPMCVRSAQLQLPKSSSDKTHKASAAAKLPTKLPTKLFAAAYLRCYLAALRGFCLLRVGVHSLTEYHYAAAY